MLPQKKIPTHPPPPTPAISRAAPGVKGPGDRSNRAGMEASGRDGRPTSCHAFREDNRVRSFFVCRLVVSKNARGAVSFAEPGWVGGVMIRGRFAELELIPPTTTHPLHLPPIPPPARPPSHSPIYSVCASIIEALCTVAHALALQHLPKQYAARVTAAMRQVCNSLAEMTDQPAVTASGMTTSDGAKVCELPPSPPPRKPLPARTSQAEVGWGIRCKPALLR